MAHDVFISYSSKDKPIADAVCANLEASGVRCWFAPRDIGPGEDWPTAISNAITQSQAMVLVFSSNSNSSEDVSRELNLAAENKLIIIPFKIENVEPEPGKKYYLSRTHWLDAMNPPTQEQISMLTERVKKVLAPVGEPESPVPVVPPAPLPAPVKPAPAKAASQPAPKRRLKPWIIAGAAVCGLILIILVCGGGILLGKTLLANIAIANTPTQPVSAAVTTAAPAATSPAVPSSPAVPLPFMDTSASTPTAPSLSTPAASVSVQATPGKTLHVAGDYVTWSPDGKWLVIGERQIHYYDTQTMTEVRSFQADRWVSGLAISPDSKVLAAIDETRGVILFDLASGSQLRTLPQTTISTSAVSSSFLAFTPDSTRLAVIIGDVVKLYDVASGEDAGTIVAKGANAIAFSADGKSLYAASWMGMTASDVASGAQIRSFGDASRGANRMILSPDGSKLLSAGTFTEPMILWDPTNGNQLRNFSGHTDSVTCLAFSPDGKILASASNDVTIRLWDVASGASLQTLVGPTQAAQSIAFSPDGTSLAATGNGLDVWMWSLQEK